MTWLDRLLAEHPAPADATLEALCEACPEDAAYLREERAAILEFEGALSRLEAEERSEPRRPK